VNPGIASNITATDSHAIPLSIAATLAASADVSLELFGQFAQDKTLIDHRVRYVRTNADGDIITDVMLAPVSRRPS
jgi:hypothetical protein